eukprot:2454303-Rhodomonas_salina.3
MSDTDLAFDVSTRARYAMSGTALSRAISLRARYAMPGFTLRLRPDALPAVRSSGVEHALCGTDTAPAGLRTAMRRASGTPSSREATT